MNRPFQQFSSKMLQLVALRNPAGKLNRTVDAELQRELGIRRQQERRYATATA